MSTRPDVSEVFRDEYKPMSWGARIAMSLVTVALFAPLVYVLVTGTL